MRELHREADVGERAQQLLPRLAAAREVARERLPASRFIAKNGCPAESVPSSYTGTTAGWSSRPCTLASRTNRATAPGDGATRMRLTATSRSIWRSTAITTSPMPPEPRRAPTW